VTFEGRTVEELKKAFRESVDDYLDFCKQRGEKPEKPCSGQFLVRVRPDLHHRLIVQAAQQGMSLNKYVESKLGDE
jgi:predicted HicB family RNase H-like nuclease